jgi:Carboxypeptidase regulatory-like domain
MIDPDAMKRTILFLGLLMALAACGGGALSAPAASGGTGIGGVAVAGPTCPVERPGDSACEPRPVEGAVIVVTDAAREEVGQATTDADGRFFVALPAGRYLVTAGDVEGLMGPPASMEVVVSDGEATIELEYDTGIR